MKSMLVTKLVLRLPKSLISARLPMPSNQLLVIIGRALAKDGSKTTLVTLALLPSAFQPGMLAPVSRR